jgi:type II secretory pathway pseudopilin PulG
VRTKTSTTNGSAMTTRRTLTSSAGRLGSSRGLSLIEVTVMLVVLMALVGALVPVVTDSISSARIVRARNDISQLAVALTNFQRDAGPFVFDGSHLREAQTVSSLRVVDVLRSDGDLPDVADEVPVATLGTGLFIDPSVGTGEAAIRPWLDMPASDRMDAYLRVNSRGYAEGSAGPGSGWNGPYVSKPAGADPWGHAYLINTGFLRGLPPRPGYCSHCAVFVISAGPNGRLETPFQQPIANANAFGDDLVVRIQ